MNSTKTSSEGQMGSGESDDEFYNVKLPNLPSVLSEGKGNKKGTVEKVYSPPRTKVKYDYKFDSSSDDDSDDASLNKNSKIEPNAVSQNTLSDEKKKAHSSDRNKLPQGTSKVLEKINEELKSMKNAGASKTIVEKADGVPVACSTAKNSTVGVVSPVVVVPSPMIVPHSPSVMTMGPTSMIPTIGIGNQNLMLSTTRMLNLPGNIVRGANPVMGPAGNNMVGIASPAMLSPIQNQTNMVGMTNDILRLQGNLMGIASAGNALQLQSNIVNSPALAGICMTSNMVPVQGNIAAMQSPCNVMGIQGPGSNIMSGQTVINNQVNLVGNQGSVLGSPVMSAANVPNLMKSQGNVGAAAGSAGNVLLNVNNIATNQTNRMNYSGNTDSQAANDQLSAGSKSASGPLGNISQDGYISTHNKSAEYEWKTGSKMQPGSDKFRVSSKTPPNYSPSDSDSKNWDGSNDGDDDEDCKSQESANSPNLVRDTPNTFKNDGSFMEMFKKMSEANYSKGSANKDENSAKTNESVTLNLKKPPVILSGIVGKRRGGRVLKTGLVKKVKKTDDAEEEKGPKDAWAMYMAEVKKYREASCEEEGKTRPLVK